MLFNSYEFIFAFLPLTIAGFFLVARWRGQMPALCWLVMCSTVFYGFWNPINLAIIAPSILCNFLIAAQLERRVRTHQKAALPLLVLGIIGNVLFLGYFKYRFFALDMANSLTGTHFAIGALILPLGISFITFQKIAFLVDIYSGRVREVKFARYLLFVMFFPQLVAGPIVHYREMMPQFEKIELTPKALDFAVAISLFSMGLFKKVVIADGVAAYSTPVFTQAAAGESLTFFWAWGAAFAYAFQVYFDFSGYSDMALGLARFFGVRLPLNFNSPYKASSIIELWGRWHVTLTRFLTGYVYTPMVMSLTRRRQAKGKPVLAGRRTKLTPFLALIVGPTIITMGISGLWHGAGLQFIAWGLLHGVFLSINHAWRLIRPHVWPNEESYRRVMKPLGWFLTFLCFVIAVVFFRANSVMTALHMLMAMTGANGLALPMALAHPLGTIQPILAHLGVTFEWSSGTAFIGTWLWITCLLGVVLLLPNSLDIMAQFEPALGFGGPGTSSSERWPISFCWAPNWRWAVYVGGISVVAILGLGQVSEFLYWQF